MSVQETRGGVPHIYRKTITTSGRFHQFPGVSKYLQIRTGLVKIKLYFTEEDWTNDENYIGPNNEWEGPIEAQGVWLRGEGSSSELELVAYIRRT